MIRSRFELALAGLALAACAELGSAGADPHTDAASSDPPDASAEREQPDPGEPDAAAPDAADGQPATIDPDAGNDAPAIDTLGCEGHADAILCEDFESGALDETLWTPKLTGEGKLSVANGFSREGARALAIVLPAAEATGAVIRTKAPFPLSPNHFFGRAWFHAGPEIPNVHSHLIAARGLLDGAMAKYGLDSNSAKLNSRYTHNPTVTLHGGLKKLSYPMPAEKWLCVEWEYDGENDELRYWFDGELADALTVTKSEDPPWVAPPAFTEIELGWHNYQAPTNASELEVFVDAIVLDDQRIGCGSS